MKPLLLLTTVLTTSAFVGVPMAVSARPSDSLPTTSAANIDQAGFVSIRGSDQWITIRGENRSNLVLIIVGGTMTDGPGAIMSPLIKTFQPWEKDLTVVQWDPRGAGKTFARAGLKTGKDFRVEGLTADGIAVAEHVRSLLPGREIVVIGINFGSTLGTLMVKQRPDLFNAYVGIGQIANTRADRERFAYERVLRLATAAKDQAALEGLKVSGPTPFRHPRDPVKVSAFLKAGAAYRPPAPDQTATMRQVLSAPGWTQDDLRASRAGLQVSEGELGRSWGERFNFSRISGTFALPVIVIQGEDNDVAPTPMAQDWLRGITAPSKTFKSIQIAGNHAIETHNADVLNALKTAMKGLPDRGKP